MSLPLRPTVVLLSPPFYRFVISYLRLNNSALDGPVAALSAKAEGASIAGSEVPDRSVGTQHNGHIVLTPSACCLYCAGLFLYAQLLAQHLESEASAGRTIDFASIDGAHHTSPRLASPHGPMAIYAPMAPHSPIAPYSPMGPHGTHLIF